MQPLHWCAALIPSHSNPDGAYQSSRHPHHQPPYSGQHHNCCPEDIWPWWDYSCVQHAVACHQQEKSPRKIFVFSKARWMKMKEDIQSRSKDFIHALYDHSVKDNWKNLKSHLTATMAANFLWRWQQISGTNPGWLLTSAIQQKTPALQEI